MSGCPAVTFLLSAPTYNTYCVCIILKLSVANLRCMLGVKIVNVTEKVKIVLVINSSHSCAVFYDLRAMNRDFTHSGS